MKTLHGSAFKHSRPRRTAVDGIQFDSLREARRYVDLRTLMKAGEIRCLELQPRLDLEVNGRPVKIRSEKGHGRQVRAVFDFRYEERQGSAWVTVIEDVKGIDTPVSRLKRALVEAMEGIEVRVVS